MGKSSSKLLISEVQQTTESQGTDGKNVEASSMEGPRTGNGSKVPTPADLRRKLTKLEYYVTQEKGTERAFTGNYWNEKKPGVYHCKCCDTPLFDSSTKFNSGTGWPSYYDYIKGNVKEEDDYSIPFMPRTEVMCATCDAHLGHVFKDGPGPTGQRYCINSASIQLEPRSSVLR